MAEKQIPLPLSGDEVKEAVLFKIEESLGKTCHLNSSSAYSRFKAEITIRLTLSDMGREVKDNHIVQVQQGTPAEESQEQIVDEVLSIPEMPPNQVRVETGQDVPVRTVKDGKPVIRKVKYAPRKELKK